MKSVTGLCSGIAVACLVLSVLVHNPSPVLAENAPAVVVEPLLIQEGNPRDRKEAEEIARALGKVGRMNFFETANFTWCTALPKSKMTRIMNEAERSYKIFAKDAGIRSWKKLWVGGRKCMGVILANKRDYKRYVKWYANKYPVWSKDGFIKNHSRSNWFTEPATRNIMVTHLKPNDAVFVGAVMCHLVGHQCIDRYKFNNNFTPGWLRESLGLYFQGKVHGRFQCGSQDDPYGMGEGDEVRQKGLKVSEFKNRVKKSLSRHKLKNVSTMLTLATLKELTYHDTQKGHLMVSWMLRQPGKLSKFIAATKAAWPGDIVMGNTDGKVKAQKKALKKVFDMTPEDLEIELNAYAKSGY